MEIHSNSYTLKQYTFVTSSGLEMAWIIVSNGGEAQIDSIVVARIPRNMLDGDYQLYILTWNQLWGYQNHLYRTRSANGSKRNIYKVSCKNITENEHRKTFIKRELLQQNMNLLRIIRGILTGHIQFRVPLNKIRLDNESSGQIMERVKQNSASHLVSIYHFNTLESSRQAIHYGQLKLRIHEYDIHPFNKNLYKLV